MELTKKDLKDIDAQTFNLAYRIEAEASEYARLYERTFLLRLAEQLASRVDAIDAIDLHFKEK